MHRDPRVYASAIGHHLPAIDQGGFLSGGRGWEGRESQNYTAGRAAIGRWGLQLSLSLSSKTLKPLYRHLYLIHEIKKGIAGVALFCDLDLETLWACGLVSSLAFRYTFRSTWTV